MSPRSGLQTLWQQYDESRPSAAAQLRHFLGLHTGRRDWNGMSVLDVGCGDGAIAHAFAAAGARVTAFDLEPGRATRTRARMLAARTAPFSVLAADAHRLPFARDTFDVVILSDLIEHVKAPLRVMVEAARVLRPGGAVCVSMPNRLSIVNVLSDPHYNVPAVGVVPRALGEFLVTRVFRVSRRFTIERYFTWDGAQRLLLQAGLRPGYVAGRYEEKLRTGKTPMAPARRWLASVARLPGLRSLVLGVLGSGISRRFVLPSWQFVGVKPTVAAYTVERRRVRAPGGGLWGVLRDRLDPAGGQLAPARRASSANDAMTTSARRSGAAPSGA